MKTKSEPAPVILEALQKDYAYGLLCLLGDGFCDFVDLRPHRLCVLLHALVRYIQLIQCLHTVFNLTCAVQHV